ncbi:hypothetical protein VKT23_019185 [Stygiomarasmius scandens]|uniref:Uncharacterized protein n=1 Tax=Marasmiellus scandens TaxID=2682957 RepID=A0ABR1IM83_9AGAR
MSESPLPGCQANGREGVGLSSSSCILRVTTNSQALQDWYRLQLYPRVLLSPNLGPVQVLPSTYQSPEPTPRLESAPRPELISSLGQPHTVSTDPVSKLNGFLNSRLPEDAVTEISNLLMRVKETYRSVSLKDRELGAIDTLKLNDTFRVWESKDQTSFVRLCLAYMEDLKTTQATAVIAPTLVSSDSISGPEVVETDKKVLKNIKDFLIGLSLLEGEQVEFVARGLSKLRASDNPHKVFDVLTSGISHDQPSKKDSIVQLKTFVMDELGLSFHDTRPAPTLKDANVSGQQNSITSSSAAAISIPSAHPGPSTVKQEEFYTTTISQEPAANRITTGIEFYPSISQGPTITPHSISKEETTSAHSQTYVLMTNNETLAISLEYTRVPYTTQGALKKSMPYLRTSGPFRLAAPSPPPTFSECRVLVHTDTKSGLRSLFYSVDTDGTRKWCSAPWDLEKVAKTKITMEDIPELKDRFLCLHSDAMKMDKPPRIQWVMENTRSKHANETAARGKRKQSESEVDVTAMETD